MEQIGRRAATSDRLDSGFNIVKIATLRKGIIIVGRKLVITIYGIRYSMHTCMTQSFGNIHNTSSSNALQHLSMQHRTTSNINLIYTQ
jgi:hypothetical protein